MTVMAIMNNDLLFCRFWKSVIEKPKFWVSVVLYVNKENQDKVTQSRRINIVPEIRLYTIEVLEYLCRAVIKVEANLKRLVVSVLGRIDLLDPELLSQAVVRLEECHLYLPSLSQTQIDSLFTAIQKSENLKLKMLELAHDDCSKVPPEILASALVKLEDVNVCAVTENQVKCLYDKMANSEIMNIRHIDSNLFDDENVSPELFAEAFVRVERLDTVSIDQEKTGALLRKIASLDSMKLKSLILEEEIDLSSFSSAVVCEAVVKLEELTIRCVLNPNLATEIFTRVAHCEPLKLKALSLYAEDLSSVSPEVLTQAVSRLEKVELPGCQLSPSQLKSLLNQVADGKCLRLKHLDLQMNDMNRVPMFSDLADGKCSKLKHLDITVNNISRVPKELLVAATQRLESVNFVNLEGSALTTEQLTVLHQMVAEMRSGSLKVVGISRPYTVHICNAM